MRVTKDNINEISPFLLAYNGCEHKIFRIPLMRWNTQGEKYERGTERWRRVLMGHKRWRSVLTGHRKMAKSINGAPKKHRLPCSDILGRTHKTVFVECGSSSLTGICTERPSTLYMPAIMNVFGWLDGMRWLDGMGWLDGMKIEMACRWLDGEGRCDGGGRNNNK